MRKLKNRPRATEEDLEGFLKALRYYNYLLKEKQRKDSFSRTKKHEKLYKKDFCNYIYEKVSEDMLIPTAENCYNFQSSLVTKRSCET